MTPQSLKVLIFDFDGVIIESNEIKHQAFNDIFSELDEKVKKTAFDYHFQHPAIDRYRKFAHVTENILNLPRADAEEKQKLWAEKFSALTEKALRECETVRGAEEFLQRAKEKWPLYLASATPTNILLPLLEDRSMNKIFKKVYGAPLVKSQVIEEICQLEEVSKEEVLFIGDSLSDLDAAVSATVPFIGRQTEADFPLGTNIVRDLEHLEKVFIEGRLL